MKIISLITFCLMMISGTAQDLKGKWLCTKEGDTYIIPEHLILELEQDSVKYYSFDELKSNHAAQIKENQVIFRQGTTWKFNFINDNRILLQLEGEKQGINQGFVRLVPTKTRLKKEEIENLQFDFIWNGEKIKIKFNERSDEDSVKSPQNSRDFRIYLEKIDSTLFASIYESGKRQEIVPIKEITEDKMVLYGFPREPYEIENRK